MISSTVKTATSSKTPTSRLTRTILALIMAFAAFFSLSACTSPSLWFKSDDQKIDMVVNSKQVKQEVAKVNSSKSSVGSVAVTHQGKTIIYTLKLKNQGYTDADLKKAMSGRTDTMFEAMHSSMSQIIQECKDQVGVDGVKVRVDVYAEHGTLIASRTFDN